MVLFTQGREVVHIFHCVRVVVAVKLSCNWLDTGSQQLLDELLGASDAAESDGPGRGFGDGDSSPQAPSTRTIELQVGIGWFRCEHDGIGAPQRRERFTQAADGE